MPQLSLPEGASKIIFHSEVVLRTAKFASQVSCANLTSLFPKKFTVGYCNFTSNQRFETSPFYTLSLCLTANPAPPEEEPFVASLFEDGVKKAPCVNIIQ